MFPRINGRAAAATLLVLLASGTAHGGARPVLSWDDEGGTDWSSGYILAYGSGKGPSNLPNVNLRRSAGLKAAYLEATRVLFRSCLDLTIRERLRVRDYLRDDAELQETLRRRVGETPPWGVRLAEDGRVDVALRFPLGGEGGLSDILGSLERWSGEDQPPAPYAVAGGFLPSEEKITGIVLLASRQLLAPSLRPRILGGDGSVLVTWENAGDEARQRPAYVAYYDALPEALADDAVAPNPIVVAADQSRGAGTDLVLPRFLLGDIIATSQGRAIIEDVRIVVVLQ